jgi:hypothetical protein
MSVLSSLRTLCYFKPGEGGGVGQDPHTEYCTVGNVNERQIYKKIGLLSTDVCALCMKQGKFFFSGNMNF